MQLSQRPFNLANSHLKGGMPVSRSQLNRDTMSRAPCLELVMLDSTLELAPKLKTVLKTLQVVANTQKYRLEILEGFRFGRER